MTTLRAVEAWRMFVQALACCEGFSILRTNDCHEDAWEMKQRVYWTCLKSELWVDQNQNHEGMPNIFFIVSYDSN